MSEISALKPGTIFGRDFRIVRALRAGGMGAVYVVEQLSTGKPRALKIMAAEFAQNPDARERFVLEARAASRVDSDHVVEIVTAGLDEETGALFLVMELLRGEELADSLDRIGPLPLGDTVEVITQVGHALELAHSQGIVHRDIKPENIILAASRRRDVPFTAKILDFGIAKLAADSAKTGTQPLGTPLYMAPEQTDRKGKIVPGTDVWALGLMAFRMLTGRHFWLEADGGTLAGLLREICLEEIPFASVRAREFGVDRYLPPGFDAWFAQCVNRNPEARFPEAGACVRSFAELVSPASMPKGKLVIEAPPTNAGDFIAAPLTADFPGLVRKDQSAASLSSELPTQALATTENASKNAATQSALASSAPAAPALNAVPVPPKTGSSLLFPVLAVFALAVGGGFFFVFKATSTSSTNTSPGSSSGPAQSAAPTPSASASAASKTPATEAQPTCPKGMIFVQGGKMYMGARDLNPEAKPPHEVSVDGFCLDRTEVTLAAYMECAGHGECEKPLDKVNWLNITPDKIQRFSPLCNAGHNDRMDHPVNCIAWAMADNYCKKNSARLPTEAEWEFAARGKSQRKYPWGDEEPTETRLNACGSECQAWLSGFGENRAPMYAGDDKFPGTAPVGSFPEGASSHGILDLAGNVWEWTADYFAPYTEAAQANPKGPAAGTERIARGGDFLNSNRDWARPAWRWKTDPEVFNHAIGFRCAANPSGTSK